MTDRDLCLNQNLFAGLAGLPAAFPSLAWLAPEVSRLFADEIERLIKEDEQAHAYAPDQYTLSLAPRDLEQLAEHASQLQIDIARGLRGALKSCGLLVIREPHVTLASDPTLSSRQARATAWHSRDPLKFSKTQPTADPSAPGRPPPGAFLIVEGRRHFRIAGERVTIGRRLDNDLVLDDPHVSRRHAEIHLQANRYFLLDMQSTVGTLINGRPIQRQSLTPGDVITIADMQLIYGEDAGPPSDETPPYSPPFRPEMEDPITPLHLRLPTRGTRGNT